MLYDLFDYQRDAAVAVLENLTRGGGEWRSGRHLSSFALSAVTGSGKTVIAAAVAQTVWDRMVGGSIPSTPTT